MSIRIYASANPTEELIDEQEEECASYCLKVFLWNTVNMNNKIEACDKKSMQMSVLQNQLDVLKLKETMYEKTIKEKEVQCSRQEKLNEDVASIRDKLENMTENKQLEDILKQLESSRAIIEEKNEQIRSLKTKLQINEFLLGTCKSNITLSPAALVRQDMSMLETSCSRIENTTEIWKIQVPGMEPFRVRCDGIIAGPGWTVIQRRVDGTVDFNRSWDEYRTGFGDLDGNFFVGLEKLYRMTIFQPHELFVYLQNFDNEIRYAHYSSFSIGSEDDAYKLKDLGEFAGDAGDALKMNLNMKFTTFDRDNDKRGFDNCSIERQGGWWFNQCARSNLNGRYFERELDKWEGIWWWNWQETRTLQSVQMLIRSISQK
ncbi:fibrinogen-like protein A isoform X1 [Drosophila grimshawi]|uniref:fibrinogen-like protein A isoform X1 n=1 Tax=Drosophila grimshawi TaxID=7222 RepID=UPI001C934E81|nr:fibrinogen-like protein A isoform X1 [Drosophila grimshawi]